jgi:hypothetical protein
MSVAITLADTGMSIFSLSTTSSREGDDEEEDEREGIERVQCEVEEAWYPSCGGSFDVVRSRGAAGTPPLSCAA